MLREWESESPEMGWEGIIRREPEIHMNKAWSGLGVLRAHGS